MLETLFPDVQRINKLSRMQWTHNFPFLFSDCDSVQEDHTTVLYSSKFILRLLNVVRVRTGWMTIALCPHLLLEVSTSTNHNDRTHSASPYDQSLILFQPVVNSAPQPSCPSPLLSWNSRRRSAERAPLGLFAAWYRQLEERPRQLRYVSLEICSTLH